MCQLEVTTYTCPGHVHSEYSLKPCEQRPTGWRRLFGGAALCPECVRAASLQKE